MIIIYHTISLHTSLALDFYQIHFKAGLRQALLLNRRTAPAFFRFHRTALIAVMILIGCPPYSILYIILQKVKELFL
jgi:hypothetical protein